MGTFESDAIGGGGVAFYKQALLELDPASAVRRPRRALVGCERVALAPGETRTVTIAVKASQLAYSDAASASMQVGPGPPGLTLGDASDATCAPACWCRRRRNVADARRCAPRATLAGDAGGDLAGGVGNQCR